MRVEQVDDGDGEADHEADGPGDDDQPEAPAELEGELRRMSGVCHDFQRRSLGLPMKTNMPARPRCGCGVACRAASSSRWPWRRAW